jgi:hypothetical protein
MLRIIQKMMMAKGYAYVVLDGSTPQVSLRGSLPHLRLSTPAPGKQSKLLSCCCPQLYPQSSAKPRLYVCRRV